MAASTSRLAAPPLDANVKLSQRGIAVNRLAAHGNAGYAPVASNASADGRAKNRRVEMALQ